MNRLLIRVAIIMAISALLTIAVTHPVKQPTVKEIPLAQTERVLPDRPLSAEHYAPVHILAKESVKAKVIIAPKPKPKIKPAIRKHRVAVHRFSAFAGGAGGIAARIRHCESGGNYRAQNSHSTASGAYQFLNSTWTAVTGKPAPASAYSPAIQDAAFWQAWAGGRGAGMWAASRSCWG
jgi:hypothetical protein